MTSLNSTKPRTAMFTLLAAACIFSLVSACSSKKKHEGEDAALDPSAATSDENGAPIADTDAAPPADGQKSDVAAAAGTTDGSAPVAQASTDKPEKPTKPKSGKSARHAAKKLHVPAVTEPAPATDTSYAANNAAAMDQTNAQANAAPAPIATQAAPVQAEPVQAAPTTAQNSNPEQTAAARTPANADDELSGESSSGGSLLESLMAYRAALMAAVGLALAGAGGFAFWKKRQAAI